MAQEIPLRSYAISKCFGCQYCLVCGAVCVYEMCSCELDQTPPRRQKKQSNIKAALRRSFTVPPTSKACITSPTQLDFFESCSEHFGYGLEFIASFDLYFCSTCNSRYQQAKNKAIIPFQRLCIRILNPQLNHYHKLHHNLLHKLLRPHKLFMTTISLNLMRIIHFNLNIPMFKRNHHSCLLMMNLCLSTYNFLSRR